VGSVGEGQHGWTGGHARGGLRGTNERNTSCNWERLAPVFVGARRLRWSVAEDAGFEPARALTPNTISNFGSGCSSRPVM
jgi:hypothetical protein